MDGTMIDNMSHHKNAWIEFLKRQGIHLTPEEYKKRFSGKKNKQIFEEVFGKTLSDEEVAKFGAMKEGLYQELYASHFKEVNGLTQIINELKRRNLKVAIATTAPKMNRNWGLRLLKLTDIFDLVLGEEHVVRGKPDPEIYLKSAEKLGVKPEECLVFEDSPAGVEAAKRAGMKVVGIMTTHSAEELEKADALMHDFTELSFTNK